MLTHGRNIFLPWSALSALHGLACDVSDGNRERPYAEAAFKEGNKDVRLNASARARLQGCQGTQHEGGRVGSLAQEEGLDVLGLTAHVAGPGTVLVEPSGTDDVRLASFGIAETAGPAHHVLVLGHGVRHVARMGQADDHDA